MKGRKGKGSYNKDSASIVASLKTCANHKDLCKGRLIHADLLTKGLLENNMYVGCALVNMYGKCGEVEKAQEVFDILPCRNVVMWTSLISGYAQSGFGEEALNCFAKMRHEGILPNEVTFLCILKACGSVGASDKCKEIHAEIAREGLLERSIIVGNALIDMYVKCGKLNDAREVFDELPNWDVVSWNALISGFVKLNHGEEALEHFAHMREEGFSPDEVTFVCILKACGSTKSISMGEEIHAEVGKEGLHLKNGLVGNALVDMYVKCSELEKAQTVFNELLFRDVVSWNAIIGGYAQHDYGEEALICYARLPSEALYSNPVTYICILKACASIKAYEKGKIIHAHIQVDGSMEEDVLLGNALVDMYGKCGALSHAQEVFEKLQYRDVDTWNALLTSYIQNKQVNEAFSYFDEMQREGLSPNIVTFVCILKACSSIRALCKGKEIHFSIALREEEFLKDILLSNALIDMYAKCGALDKAQEVFDGLLVWDVVSSTTLISGYSQYGHAKEAINCYNQMHHKSLLANSITFACILNAYGIIGAVKKGKEIHTQIIIKKEGMETDILVGNALVDMYGKCGELTKAQEVFDKLPVQDVVSWTSIISGYAKIGEDDMVVELFNLMIEEGIEPNITTFTVVLYACSHSGLLGKGQMYFEMMITIYGIMPTLDHHTCMIDLFGRAGYFGEAIVMIRNMAAFNYLPSWIALLGACQKWGNVKLGRRVFEHAIELDENDGSLYVCMYNIYAVAAMQKESEKLDMMNVKNEASYFWNLDYENVDSLFVENEMFSRSKKNTYEI